MAYFEASRSLPIRPLTLATSPVVKSNIADLILATFGTQDAVKVATCESGLNPNAVNNNPKTGDYSVGLFQINLHGKLASGRPSEEWLKVPENNIAYAYKMYLSQGLKPWTCANKLNLI